MTEAAGGNKGKTAKMTCPECGGEMNFHAEKINQSARPSSKRGLGSEFRSGGESGELVEFCGVVEEIHACRGCGAIGTRRAS